ncbi:uncharacterized protein LOC122393568 [Amphibalanus amphitrite]|uniref:uncharacterized protein LOC122393568 n=1 Tax=Amphibalanus amphitrite TaxID=1232801 RepID=UPI001C92012F|nr:uncharacterized protein LOC122393568 [Amphibalanus amphitrite]
MELLEEHPRYRELLLALDTNNAWHALGEIADEYSSLLSPTDLAVAAHQPSPSRFLLERITLLNGPLTVHEAFMLLESLDGAASAAADLLRPPQPLRVRPLSETNSACVWAPIGGRLELLCQAEAWPPPSFQWRRDGRPVPPEAGGDRARLCVQPFSAADAGQYCCQVLDAAGGAVSAGAVTVEPRQAPPRPLERRVTDVTGGELGPDGSVSASGERPLQLQVRWAGWPEPRLRWLRDHQPVDGADGGTLTLLPGPGATGGTYVCVAQNAVGEVHSDPFRVEFDSRPVVIEHPQTAQRCHPIGRPLRLRCKAFCRRQVKVVWRHSVQDADSGRDEVVPCSQVMTEPQPAAGLVTSEVRLTPAERDVRRHCGVTCELLAEGDFENSFTQSLPARFRVVYPAHSKMALIIGNSNYHHLEKLQEVGQDVADFEAAMRRLGFGTLVAMDLTTERSRRAVEYFARVAAPDAYLAVLVAGHGFTYQRRDYLAPVDHPALDSGTGVHPSRCLSMLDDIEDRLQRTSPKQLLICGDMCRTMNDACATAEAAAAAGAPGAPAGQPPRSAANVVRLFSTQMGHEAMDDSKFMRCLLANIERDIPVQEMGVQTLRALGSITDGGPAADQIQQHPIMELSMAEHRSLQDPADHRTALDEHCELNTTLEKLNLRLGIRCSNYVWDSEPELLLTLRLDPCTPYYVWKVLPHPDGHRGLSFALENNCRSGVSSWRVTGLPASGGRVRLQTIIGIGSADRRDQPAGFFHHPPLLLQLHPYLGLVAEPGPGLPPDTKVSNADR